MVNRQKTCRFPYSYIELQNCNILEGLCSHFGRWTMIGLTTSPAKRQFSRGTNKGLDDVLKLLISETSQRTRQYGNMGAGGPGTKLSDLKNPRKHSWLWLSLRCGSSIHLTDLTVSITRTWFFSMVYLKRTPIIPIRVWWSNSVVTSPCYGYLPCIAGLSNWCKFPLIAHSKSPAIPYQQTQKDLSVRHGAQREILHSWACFA